MTSAHGTPDAGQLLTPAEVRTRLRIGRRTLQRWKAAGIITPTKVLPSGHARYSVEYIDALVDRLAAVRAAEAEAAS